MVAIRSSKRAATECLSGVASQQHGRLVDLMDVITQLRPQYQQAWLAEYTPYRLGEALGRWDLGCQHWLRLQTRLDNFAESYRQGQPLPELEALMKAD